MKREPVSIEKRLCVCARIRPSRSIRHRLSWVFLCITLLAASAQVSRTFAQDVAAGLDLFQTSAGSSSSDEFNSGLGGTPIPADFFDPGSDPFDASIPLDGQGFPFTGNGSCLAPADTIVQRLTDAILPACPSSDTVPIEIVALSLVSSSPITVTFNGGQNPELWDVRVCLSDVPQQIGGITINQTCPDGGDFTSTLPVQPKFIFTRQSDSAVRIFDTGIAGMPPSQFNAAGGWVHQSTISQVTQVTPGAEVDRNCDGIVEVLTAGTTNFVPGITPTCDCTTPLGTAPQLVVPILEQAQLDTQSLIPAQDPPDTNGNGIPDACEPAPKVRFTKWLQDPHPDGVGFDVASDVDWFELTQGNQTAPNWVVADDFQSDGRPITCVRWWGSYIDPVFLPPPPANAPGRASATQSETGDIPQPAIGATPSITTKPPMISAGNRMTSAGNGSAAPAETQRVVKPGSVFARTSVAAMRVYDLAHPDVRQRVAPFPREPSRHGMGPVRGAGQQDPQFQSHLPSDLQSISLQGLPDSASTPSPNAPALLDNFSGILDNQTSIPPDTMGAAGPFHLVEMINTGFTVFFKNGVVASSQISLRSFFSALGTASGQPAESPFDPKILYDQYVNRWVVTADGGGVNSWVLLGISNSNNPALGWNLFAIQANVNSGGVNHTNDFADFPGFGLDPNNIIVTNNMFINGGGFRHSDVWVIKKAAMISGVTLTLGTNFSLFHNPGNAGDFTLRPCQTYGQTSANAVNYLLDETSSGTSRFIRIKEITGTGASAVLNTFGGNDYILVLGFNFSINGTQPSGCTPVETGGTRLRNCVWRNGKVWTAQSVGVGGRGQIAWYEIDPTAVGSQFLPGVPLQQGRVSDSSLSFYYPSIAVNKFECVALGFSGSDANTFISAYYTGRDPTVDPPNTMQPVALLKAGVDTYFKDFGSGRNRWGDYSATTVDPADDITFWTLQEYAEAEIGAGNCGANTGRWSTWWGKFTCLANSGACCFHDGSCTPLAQADCEAQGGRFQGVGVDCSTVNCPASQVDGWLLSFHTDLPAGQNPAGPFSEPLDLLGLYFCPASAVTITPTGVIGWDGHEVFEYFVELDQCHLVHSLTDPRPGATPPLPATQTAFLETDGFIYWLDIQAVVGHSYVHAPVDLFASEPVGGGGSGISRVWEVFVPGGSDTALPNQAISALSGLANVGTHLIGVTGNNGGGTIHTIGFDGVEISSRAPTDPAITALSGAATAPPTAAGFTAGHVYATTPGGDALWDLGLDGLGPDTLHANMADSSGTPSQFVQGLAFDPVTGVLYGSSFFPDGLTHLISISGSGLATDLGEIKRNGASLSCGQVAGLAFHGGSLYGSLGGSGACSSAGEVLVIPIAAPGLSVIDHTVTASPASVSALAGGISDRWLEIVTSSFAPDHFWGWHTSPVLFNDEAVTGMLAISGGDWLYQNWQVVDGSLHNLPRVDQAYELLTTDPPPPPSCSCPGDVDGNNVLNGLDIQGFVDCLLGTAGPGINCACADLDNSGVSDILDVPLFVTALMNMLPCP